MSDWAALVATCERLEGEGYPNITMPVSVMRELLQQHSMALMLLREAVLAKRPAMSLDEWLGRARALLGEVTE